MIRSTQNSDQWASKLCSWYSRVKKPLPWRSNPTPYRVWVAEIMSQQTTLQVVVPRYQALIRQLPHVTDLAYCDEPVLRSLWAGLGYYARARNLMAGARLIVESRAGRFPESYVDWLTIPGCGPYTAAVIASICFDEAVACVDGNVVRVVSRLLGTTTREVWSSAGQKEIREYVSTHVSEAPSPGDFNQGMMELGQELCRRTGPRCSQCPLRTHCRAYDLGIAEECPPPKPRAEKIRMELTSCVILDEAGRVAVTSRTGRFLKGTVGLPLTELPSSAIDGALSNDLGASTRFVEQLEGSFQHTITKHGITGRVALLRTVGVMTSGVLGVLSRLLDFENPVWLDREAVHGQLASALDRKAWRIAAAKLYR